jgi:hypothetical protein
MRQPGSHQTYPLPVFRGISDDLTIILEKLDEPVPTLTPPTTPFVAPFLAPQMTGWYPRQLLDTAGTPGTSPSYTPYGTPNDTPEPEEGILGRTVAEQYPELSYRPAPYYNEPYGHAICEDEEHYPAEYGY